MNRTLNTRTRFKIIGSDYSAQEPRLTAHMSQDPEMIKAYQEGKDLYCVIGTGMFNNNYEDNLEFYPAGTEIEIDGQKVICGNKTHVYEEGKARRKAAKTMLLALLYGMSDATAGAMMGKTKEEGEQLRLNFFKRFPSIEKLIENSKTDLKTKRFNKFTNSYEYYVEDWAGRRRRLPDIQYGTDETAYEAVFAEPEDNFNPFLECSDQNLNSEFLIRAKRGLTMNTPNKVFEERARKARDGYIPRAKCFNPKKDDDYEYCKKKIILSAFTGRYHQAERQCLNARIQGGAASLTKLAMVNIFKDEELNKYLARLVATVHDEILVECPAFYADQVIKRLPQVMIDTATPFISVPMKCDPYCVDRWYSDVAAAELLHEFKTLQEKKKLTKKEALDKIIILHPELSEACIKHTLETGEDLDFKL